jgi:ABC-type nickel/cobalt efflux system permease component RcnA
MHPAIKVVIGAIMVVLGIYSSLTYSTEFLNLVKAVVGPLLVLVGAFIVWLESDELKLSRESDSDRGFDVQQNLKEQASKTGSSSEKSDETENASSNDRIECPDCGKEFDTERGMKIHRTQKHA